MPIKGQTISDSTAGFSYQFIETAKDTNGERVTMQAIISRKGELVPMHVHVLQDESFEIVSGKLTVVYDGKTTVLSAGEKMTLPKGKGHNHYNSEDTPVTYIHKVSPALDFDHFIETLVGLAIDGKAKDGKYGMMQELVTIKYLDSKAYLADMPMAVQNILAAIIAPIGRLMGYRAIYKKYSGIEK